MRKRKVLVICRFFFNFVAMIRKLSAPLIAVGLVCASCGNSKHFSVEIDSQTVGTQKLTVLYTLPDGNRVLLEPTAVDGHAEFTGNAPEVSFVEIFTSTGAKFVDFTAKNGDKIVITFADDSLRIDGVTTVLPIDSVAAADTPECELFTPPSVITGKDTAEVWDAEGVWIFTSSLKERTQAVMDSIRARKKHVRDVFIGPDYNAWRDIVRHDSATWKQGLLPEGPVDLPALTSTPLMIEVDSAGMIVGKVTLGR